MNKIMSKAKILLMLCGAEVPHVKIVIAQQDVEKSSIAELLDVT